MHKGGEIMQEDVAVVQKGAVHSDSSEELGTPVTDSLRGILKGIYDMEAERQLALSKKYATFS